MNSKQTPKTCATCAYSAYYNSDMVECRLRAPKVPTAEGLPQFPIMSRGDYCGGYKRKGGGISVSYEFG